MSGASGYYVYRDGSQVGSPSGTSYSDNLSDTASHSYTVSATNGCGTSGLSSAASGWANATPSVPTGVSASDGVYTNKVSVSWNSVSGAGGYQVWRNTSNSSDTASEIAVLAATGYDDYSITAGVTNYYWVKATNSCGASGFSSPDSGFAAGAAPNRPLISSACLSNHVFLLSISAQLGRVYWIQASADLISWTVLYGATATGSRFDFTDTSAAQFQPAVLSCAGVPLTQPSSPSSRPQRQLQYLHE